jgi:hypothetical protein
MQWILVYVSLTFHGHPIAQELGRYDSMANCFVERELALVSMGSENGYPLEGTQLVCLYAKEQAD